MTTRRETWFVIDEQGFITHTFTDDGAAPVTIERASVAKRASGGPVARLKAENT